MSLRAGSHGEALNVPSLTARLLVVLAALAVSACSPVSSTQSGSGPHAEKKAGQPAPDEFSVMTWNLDRFCFDDRNKDGQPNEFKPEPEVQAVIETIAAEKPDILACQEVGDGPAFQRLRDELKKHGLNYEHAEQVVRPGNTAHLALLSRHPILATSRITNETYTVQGQQYPVLHGFLVSEIEVDSRYRFRLIVASLRGKDFAEVGQTEMRRNEARLLNKVVRYSLDADSTNRNLLVVGCFADQPRSAALAEAIGKNRAVLADLRPVDSSGESWTHHDAGEDLYERTDYILASADMMKEVVSEKSRVVRPPASSRASSHRPVVAVFRTRDL